MAHDTKGSATGQGERFLEIALGEEAYAIPLLRVREVIATPKTTPIPNSPAHFVGMMNLRGQVLNVIDLRKKLIIKPRSGNKEEAVVIIDVGTNSLGVVVDSVDRVISATADSLSEPPLSTKKSVEHIKAIHRHGEKLVTILDIDKAIGAAELSGQPVRATA